MKKCLLIVLAAAAFQCASAQSWNLTGNSGTTSANFIGTKDSNAAIQQMGT